MLAWDYHANAVRDLKSVPTHRWNMIDSETAANIRRREAMLQAWIGPRTSYDPATVPDYIAPPTNAERSALEVYEFCTNPPDRYFLYIREGKPWSGPGMCAPLNQGHEWLATTWTGEQLGTVSHGKAWRDNFGGMRVPVTVRAVNGRTYHGTYYKSAGSYARVRLAKR